MTSFEIDTVKAEKAVAMRRYKRNRNCRLCLRAFFVFSLFCCTFSFLPGIEHLAAVHFYLFNHRFFVFFLINALLFIIYLLSTTEGQIDAVSQPDLYSQYVCHSSSYRCEKSVREEKQSLVSPSPECDSGGDTFSDKQIVLCENVNHAPSMEENPVRCVSVTTETYYTEKKSYRRTRSDKYSIEKKKKRSQRSELRRSETDNGRELVVAGSYCPTRKSMQELNNEEFRLKIESFIARTKKVLRDENVAVLMEERSQSFTAISYI